MLHLINFSICKCIVFVHYYKMHCVYQKKKFLFFSKTFKVKWKKIISTYSPCYWTYLYTLIILINGHKTTQNIKDPFGTFVMTELFYWSKGSKQKAIYFFVFKVVGDGNLVILFPLGGKLQKLPVGLLLYTFTSLMYQTGSNRVHP